MVKLDCQYYSDFEKISFQGYLVHQENAEINQVLVIYPDAFGLSSHFKDVANAFVKENRAVFCVDLYGNQKICKNYQEAQYEMNLLDENKKIFTARSRAPINFIRNHFGNKDLSISTMGYCFGAVLALEVIRSGMDITSAITLHGKIFFGTKNIQKKSSQKVLIFHGEKDPFISMEEIDLFKKEMANLKSDVTVVTFANSAHSFTNPLAGSNINSGSAYNELATKRSYKMIESFLNEN
ncbi:dienelactone hydrolase family protein [Silvanigrella aquatica]|uniref:Dienelactone hydrolase domain-containing protein n=1 Tax=Silvanigrella aquatica TaxID=1915309 RepID=A0A1L4D225_9BACT|nr:dienelactone hydrolase family protein [Silvanigrella aquatica]APJ04241.1 hypothetical protein AXG55_10110 [Silvanigrella aquatica]